MILFDHKHYLMLNKISLKGESRAMSNFIKNLKSDKSDLIEYASEEDVELFSKQKKAYDITLNFLKQFDREVALSFLATNMQLRGELGMFYDYLLEELS